LGLSEEIGVDTVNRNKKKLKFKKARRTLDRGTFFPKKEAREVMAKDYFLRRAFPDCEERQAYITALIRGLEEEPIIPSTQFTRNERIAECHI